MKNRIKLFLEKGSLLQWKGTFVWQKSAWIIQKGRYKSNSPKLDVVFDTFDSNQENLFFLKKKKKGTFNEAFDPRTLCLFKITPPIFTLLAPVKVYYRITRNKCVKF